MKWYQAAALGSAGTAGAGLVAWKTMFPWIEYDLQIMRTGKRLLAAREEAMKSLLIDKFEAHVLNHPKKTFIIFEDNAYTYEFVDQMACKVANIAKNRGLKAKDSVAIVIQNEPAFIWTFLGFQKLGVTVGLINHNLRLRPLVHSLLSANPEWIIVGSGESLLVNIVEVQEELGKIPIFVQGLGNKTAPTGMHSFDVLMNEALSTAICPQVRASLTLSDTCCYIYTSGTTGTPKPADLSSAKFAGMALVLFFVDVKDSDVVYTPLPLYHSSGIGIGVAGTIFKGCTLVLRRKFSARHFWSDCRRYNVTIIQYIGELFRYLLSQPPSDLDSQHKVRAAIGNGLRKDIWMDVENRYKIPDLVEFFGATEGPALLFNRAHRPGAVGRLSPFMNRIDPDPKVLVKYDVITAQPLRDSNGRCIQVAKGEPGLFLTRVPAQLNVNGTFKVYRGSKEASEKKLVRNAFVDGDLYFNFGDVLVQDKDYFVYFTDRIGDTFRWKGENVSTTELANVITSLPFVQDANVYGVTIPGYDGRAGMVSLTLENGFELGSKELKHLYDHVTGELPTYARPLFVRLLKENIITGTFKQRKVELLKEGYDINKIKDGLFFIDNDKGTYRTLTAPDLASFLKSKL